MTKTILAPDAGRLDTVSADPAEQARRVCTAIEHHRAEYRRLMTAVGQHRTALAKLIVERDQHVAALRRSGWQLAPIGRLYQLTRERVRQITAGCGATGEGVD